MDNQNKYYNYKLNRCPVCLNKDVSINVDIKDNCFDLIYYVWCPGCGASVESKKFKTVPMAVDAWNRWAERRAKL